MTGETGPGLMILLGVGKEDTPAVAASMAEKLANLRIFEDAAGKMNLSLLDVKGGALVVSQFTLYGDARGQRRPSFISAAPPDMAKNLNERIAKLRHLLPAVPSANPAPAANVKPAAPAAATKKK